MAVRPWQKCQRRENKRGTRKQLRPGANKREKRARARPEVRVQIRP